MTWLRRWLDARAMRRAERLAERVLDLSDAEAEAWRLFEVECQRSSDADEDVITEAWRIFDRALAHRRWLAASVALQDARSRYHAAGLPVARLLAGRGALVVRNR